jgi:hypothetical protein
MKMFNVVEYYPGPHIVVAGPLPLPLAEATLENYAFRAARTGYDSDRSRYIVEAITPEQENG